MNGSSDSVGAELEVDHVGIVVRDLAQAKQTLETLFGLTVAEELESNAFVRVWRGLDGEGSEQVTALGDPATLILWGPDYDGGHKAWVRWPDGRDEIVPGSQVKTR